MSEEFNLPLYLTRKTLHLYILITLNPSLVTSLNMNSAPQRDREKRNQQLMQQINDMLLAAGYFRARISGLDDFDKVTSIFTFRFLVDSVGLLLELTMTLILNSKMILQWAKRCIFFNYKHSKLSERVVKALEAMKCPSRIYPHQIQGLDYEKILPVVK